MASSGKAIPPLSEPACSHSTSSGSNVGAAVVGGAVVSVTPVNTVTLASFDLVRQAKLQLHTEILDISTGLLTGI